jgi:hypothetical protein
MNEALKISPGDLSGPVLVRFGQLHRSQVKGVFASEGATGASGRWEPLSPRYAAWKRRAFPGRRILVLSGEMKAAFTTPSHPKYVQGFRVAPRGGTFFFGAYDDIAYKHFHGIKPLPIRDMITKTALQVAEFSKRLVDWYRMERIPQVLRHYKPRGGR